MKTLKSDDVSTFSQRHFQVKMNKEKLLEYKCTKQVSYRIKSSAIKCEKIFDADHILVSYDVTALFTNVPAHETVEYLLKKLLLETGLITPTI